jgi:hypothetical protein
MLDVTNGPLLVNSEHCDCCVFRSATTCPLPAWVFDAAYADIKARIENGQLRETHSEGDADVNRQTGNDMSHSVC